MSRRSLSLTDTEERLVKKLRVLCDLRSDTEVIAEALSLLGFLATEASFGRAIASVDKDKNIFKEIHARALSNARARAEAA